MKNRRKRAECPANQQIAMHVSKVSIMINIVLSLFKMTAGVLAHSGAMVSDSIHSASDVFSTLIVMAGIRFANKQSDREHPYGHERMECVAAVLLAVTLFATGGAVGVKAASAMIKCGGRQGMIPGGMALGAAGLSIVVKEWMYLYTRKAAKQIGSSALMADAWHHQSDALSSVGAFAGILGARMGFPMLDPMASLLICFFIARASVDIFKDAVDQMVDKACDEDTVRALRDTAIAVDGVERIDEIRTRRFGARVYVDIEISASQELMLPAAHQIAHDVHDSIERYFPAVKHCMVHVNPF